jgi:hypothetical protein
MKKILLFALGLALPASAQDPPLDSKSFEGLELRGIGPALDQGTKAVKQ